MTAVKVIWCQTKLCVPVRRVYAARYTKGDERMLSTINAILRLFYAGSKVKHIFVGFVPE